MRVPRKPARDYATTSQNVCTATATTVGGLYLATHSITATIIGTTVASLLAGWALWLDRQDRRTSSSREEPTGQVRPDSQAVDASSHRICQR